MSLCTALGRFRHWMLTSTLSKSLCWILNFILKRSVRVRGGERVLCKCTPCLESSGGVGIKQSLSTERRHRKKEQERVNKLATAAAARELRQQQRDMRRQEVLAAEAEEEAEIARAEAEANLFPDDDFASAFGYSAFDETLNDSRSSDSGQSESKSEAASLAPPASPRKCKLFLLCDRETTGRSATQWIECLAHQPFSLPCLVCLSLGVCSCAGSAVSRVGQRFSRLRRLSDRGLCVRQRARECRPGAADSVGILSQDSARRRTGRVVVPSKAPAI